MPSIECLFNLWTDKPYVTFIKIVSKTTCNGNTNSSSFKLFRIDHTEEGTSDLYIGRRIIEAKNL